MMAPPVAVRCGATARLLLPERPRPARISWRPAVSLEASKLGTDVLPFSTRRAHSSGQSPPLPQGQEAVPYQPVHVAPGEASDGKHVGDGPGLPLQAEDAEFVGELVQRRLVVVDPVDETPGPPQRRLVHGALDLRRGASEGEDAQAVVDVDGDRTDHFREAPPGDHAHDAHLGKAQMSVHEAQREGGIVVAGRLDERDVMVVPVDGEPAVQARRVGRERRQPGIEAAGFRQRRQQRATGQHAAGDEESRGDGRAAGHGISPGDAPVRRARAGRPRAGSGSPDPRAGRGVRREIRPRGSLPRPVRSPHGSAPCS